MAMCISIIGHGCPCIICVPTYLLRTCQHALTTVSRRAGVVGLSTAVRLQEAGYDVSVVAREFPGAAETMDGRRQIDYTSAWGGAHNRWIPPAAGETGPEAQVSRRDHGFALATYGHMNATARAHPEAGITFMRGIEYLEEGVGAPTLAAAYMGLEGFRRLPEEELPADVRWGCEYRTWCVNPMVYCCFLLRRFVLGGGRCRRGDVSRGDVSRGDDGVLRLDADADADPAAAESEPPRRGRQLLGLRARRRRQHVCHEGCVRVLRFAVSLSPACSLLPCLLSRPPVLLRRLTPRD